MAELLLSLTALLLAALEATALDELLVCPKLTQSVLSPGSGFQPALELYAAKICARLQ